MTLSILAIRHAATEWNQQKRLQGRRDIPLSIEGQQQLANRRCPAAYLHAQWFCSPLLRAQQTAAALDIKFYHIEPALIEMDWGQWEGQQLSQLRLHLGEALAREESKGLDMQPPQGESPRQVQQRLLQWLNHQAGDGKIGIICHKGLLRAMLSLALNWDMTDACPVKINWKEALVFNWDPQQGLSLVDYNLPLTD
jgi:probable phosphoglycerate mutase